MKTIHRRIVAVHIVSADGKIVFGRKRPSSSGVYMDCWHIPGGGVDEGESDELAMCREIKEETGLGVSPSSLVLIDAKGSGESEKTLPGGEKVLVKMQFVIYKLPLDKPAHKVELTESDDLVNFQWFTLEELATIELTPPAKALFKRLGTDWLKV